MAKFGYENSIENFKNDDSNFILGELTKNYEFYELNDLQKNAWIDQIKILKDQLSPFLSGNIIFEYKIPRMGAIIDNVLLIDGLVFIIEFKVWEEEYKKADIDQLDNYIKILKNYHFESRDKILVPILVATEADTIENHFEKDENDIFGIIKANKHNLSNIISQICRDYRTNADLTNWSKSKYAPTPSILQAARELYETHEVKDIHQRSSDDLFLDETQDTIDRIIDDSIRLNQKSIIFLTGVPGAGKTLVGLNIATKRSVNNKEPAVFLSGNGPLVRVLQEALSRDSHQRNNISKKEARLKVISFIQPIHQFRDDAINDELTQHENIVIFDEAQRAWTKEQTADFMKRKKGIPNFEMSEPEFLISIMDRKEDWAVIICLVGQGQEINKGEAGISEWFKALQNRYPHWNIFASKEDLQLNEEFNELEVYDEDSLYLYSTIRSLDAPNLPKFVEYLLDNDKDNSRRILKEFNDDFPLFITRNLKDAKKWIKKVASEETDEVRYGLLAQSNGLRLIPDGIFVKNNIDVESWFLNDTDDIRSSNHLEIAATEFDIQGLEIDYSIVGWDANLRYVDGEFQHYKFSGTKWNKISDNNLTGKNYLINSYRVILTRARRGMVIFVPEGDDDDKTRLKEFYDGTYEYLKSIGIKELEIN
ncbi:DNA/RNA helicase domain-containing protein [Methanobrevibacter sp.]|uniref:DNA/RNA helicase domain-containing protein n=1 Tax=Methanobrevibacter sp. TaxID=66852 RepID=UPI0025E5F080|nr:DNA/RNA helicase domain-containing protein [Methanobrevibacter sp.]MBQ2961596.1 DUF2075 domain-containing protein [Methanobrevibacter sp.]